jgi:hypothetical protein
MDRDWPVTHGISLSETTTPMHKVDSLAIQMRTSSSELGATWPEVSSDPDADRRHMRVCKLCSIGFEPRPGPGRPRLYCYDCEPPGWQLVWVRGRLKLRRRRPDLVLRVVP